MHHNTTKHDMRLNIKVSLRLVPDVKDATAHD